MALSLHKLSADGHDGLRKCMAELQRSNRLYNGGIFVLFTGAKVAETGQSWCPDCVKADPMVEKALDRLSKMETTKRDGEHQQQQQQKRHIVFITCDVGPREVWVGWKSPTNTIKADATLNVKSVPTLIEYSLADGHCVEGRKIDKDEQFQSDDAIIKFIGSTAARPK